MIWLIVTSRKYCYLRLSQGWQSSWSFSRGDNLPCRPIKNTIFILGPRHRRCGSPYSIHLVCQCLSVRQVCLSVCLSTLRCNAITRKVFDLETSYCLYTVWRIKKGRHAMDFGVKIVKGQGHSDIGCQQGPLWLCQFSSFIVPNAPFLQ